jgi:hypothetical protein
MTRFVAEKAKLGQDQTQRTGQDQLQPAVAEQDNARPHPGQRDGGRTERAPVEALAHVLSRSTAVAVLPSEGLTSIHDRHLQEGQVGSLLSKAPKVGRRIGNIEHGSAPRENKWE